MARISPTGTGVALTIAESVPGAGDGGRIALNDVSGTNTTTGVETVKFADGSTWTSAQLRAFALAAAITTGNDTITGFYADDTLSGGAGNDTLNAGYGNDTLRGGTGDDVLNGEYGDDTYVWARGDGNDTIAEANYGTDTLILDAVLPGHVSVSRTSVTGVALTIAASAPGAGDGGRIVLNDISGSSSATGIETVKFADGTSWTSAQLRAFALAAAVTSGADVISGFALHDTLSGGAGNDTLSGGYGNDTLRGGSGDDVLNGESGDDTFVWARGDGNDTITEATAGTDVLVLEGVLPGQVSVARISPTGTGVALTIAESVPGAGDGGRIALNDVSGTNTTTGVETVKFADGSTWTSAQLRAFALAAAITTGNDTITGFYADDTLSGGAGNDTLNAGYGNDTLRGGTGDDVLNGEYGDDTYVWARGDGNDTIAEANYGTDTLILDAVLPGHVSVSRTSVTGVALTIAASAPGAGDGGRIVLNDISGSSSATGVETVKFADGTTWTSAQLRAFALAAAVTSGADVISGFALHDTLSGGAGNDTLSGGYGNDTLRGGSGDDVLNGESGDDTFVWARGDGNDTITEATAGTDVLVLEGVQPGQVSVARISPTGTGVALTIAESVPGAGDGGRIALNDVSGTNTTTGVETVKFADGSTWTSAQLRAFALAAAITTGNDTITGFYADDTLSGGAGNDTLNAGYGNDTLRGGTGDDVLNGEYGDDTYVWARGDGNDTIAEANYGTDTLILDAVLPGHVSVSRTSVTGVALTIAESAPGAGDGGRITLNDISGSSSATGIETVKFADGTTWTSAQLRAFALATGATTGNDVISGFIVNDTLTGGTGNDTLDGAGGNDTFVWSRGDGNDIIAETGYRTGTLDRLVLTNVTADQVQVTRSGESVLLTVTTVVAGVLASEKITLLQSYTDSSNQYGVEQIQFADGAVWDRATMRAKVTEAVGHDAGSDGHAGPDERTGRAGDVQGGHRGTAAWFHNRQHDGDHGKHGKHDQHGEHDQHGKHDQPDAGGR